MLIFEKALHRRWFDVLACSIYNFVHTLNLFSEMLLWNVALNSSMPTFITILLSNSIGEVKIRVFKSWNEIKTQNLI